MFERFNDLAHKALDQAHEEAIKLNHEYLGTEHLLLGLVKEGHGVGAILLKNLDVDYRRVRLETEKLVKKGPDTAVLKKMPQTPLANKVLDHALEEARLLHDPYIGTDHILLGLLRETDCVAAQVLSNLGVNIEKIRTAIKTGRYQEDDEEI